MNNTAPYLVIILALDQARTQGYSICIQINDLYLFPLKNDEYSYSIHSKSIRMVFKYIQGLELKDEGVLMADGFVYEFGCSVDEEDIGTLALISELGSYTVATICCEDVHYLKSIQPEAGIHILLSDQLVNIVALKYFCLHTCNR